MFTELRLEGFKGYANPTALELKPLTVLCGVNGCGKSTLLQAMLLLKQSFTGPRSPRTVRLNGDYVHLGGPIDVLHGRDHTGSARIGFAILSEHRPWVEIEHRFFRNALLSVLNNLGMALDEEVLRLDFDLVIDAEAQGVGIRAEVREMHVTLQVEGEQVFHAKVLSRGRLSEDARDCTVHIECQ